MRSDDMPGLETDMSLAYLCRVLLTMPALCVVDRTALGRNSMLQEQPGDIYAMRRDQPIIPKAAISMPWCAKSNNHREMRFTLTDRITSQPCNLLTA